MADRSTMYSSLIIVISLQLRGCKQIVEPRKYCLVRVIVFLWRVFFSIFFVSHKLGIRLNFLHSLHNLLFNGEDFPGIFFFQSFYLFISIFHGSSFIGLISSTSTGKSVMERPEEPRSQWTKEEDQRLLEYKSKNPNLSWEKIAKLAGLNRIGKSCWRRWNLEEPPRS